jgi:hypothetical protein
MAAVGGSGLFFRNAGWSGATSIKRGAHEVKHGKEEAPTIIKWGKRERKNIF